MKAKIFAKLKQEYSPLGLGDEYLMLKADALAATGLVTDDNIDAVVACQRKELEGLQKSNDKRVTDALEKERKKHEEETRKKEQEAEEARRKAEEDAARKKGEQDQTPPDNDYEALRKQVAELIAAGEKRDKEYATNLKTLTDRNTELGNTVKTLTDKNAEAEAAAAKAAHHAKITSKAKELGVPQWRIDEGFNIADDATDEVITDTLTKVANNISANLLPPGSRAGIPFSSDKPSKEDLDNLAASIVK